jgi:hypothetical protein
MRILNANIVRLLFVASVLFLCVSLLKAQTILQPVQDVIVVTFGGGEGCNVFIKYDITTVPGGMVIDSVFLTPFIISIGASWDGDAYFWNVNNQDWTEGDSCNYIYGLPVSDQVTQTGGFGTATGWGTSVDLSNILIPDYDAGHMYCSIKIKDPDDMTSVPMPGSMPVNAETLTVGNIIFDEYTIFYAREYPNAPPWLMVYHHSVGVEDYYNRPVEELITVTPNPTNGPVRITFCDHRTDHQRIIGVYDINGAQIREFVYHKGQTSQVYIWDGTDKHNIPVPSGTYFCVVTGEGYRVVALVCIVR